VKRLRLENFATPRRRVGEEVPDEEGLEIARRTPAADRPDFEQGVREPGIPHSGTSLLHARAAAHG
jgi:hypothetical protein